MTLQAYVMQVAWRIGMESTATHPMSRLSRSVIVGAGAAVGVLLIGTVALWAYYGTAVFYEIVAAGMALCL
jgi:hypothetical protein